MRRLLNRAILTMSLIMQLSFVGLLVAPMGVSAATSEACSTTGGSFLELPTWYKYLKPTFDDAKKECDITFNFPQDVGKILLAVFEIILRFAGILAIIFVIWSGVQYQLSQGEPDRVKSARSVLINALIGLAIAVSATAIVNLIGHNLG